MATEDASTVEVLDAADTSDVVSVLCEAFSDAPVMRFVLGPSERYAADLEKLVTFFVMARLLRQEVLLGVRSSRGLDAAALVSYPRMRTSPPELTELRAELWAELGADSLARYETFGRAADPLTVSEPHIHLNMIGVRAASRGRGLGRAVLDDVHELSRRDAASSGVSLVTGRESNVGLYRHFGYELIGRTDVDGAFTVWGFFRSKEAREPALT
ncbi:MAG: GNAT family N-acetyltransferase [Gemmatimonadota bacterium]